MCAILERTSEKGRDLTQPYDKSSYTHRKKSKKQLNNTTMPPQDKSTDFE